MKHFWLVWKTQFRDMIGLSYLKYQFRSNRRGLLRRLAFVPFIIFAVFSVLKLITEIYSLVFNSLHPLGQDAVVLAAAFVLAQSLSFAFGLFYLISNFYYAKDLYLLIPLPIKPSVIIGSKFLTVVINEYAITLLIVLPAFFVYSPEVSGWWFWLLAGLITIALPIIPLALASIFVIIMMRITNVRNGRGLMRVLGALLGLLLYSGVQWVQVSLRSGDPQPFYNLIAQPDSLVHLVTRSFPPSLWASKALLESGSKGLYNAGLFFFGTAAAFVFMLFMAERFFLKGLLGGNEISVKRKTLPAASTMSKPSSLFTALFLREWRNLVRSASFLMPVLINIIVVPAAFIIPLITGKNTQLMSLASAVQGPSGRQIAILGISGLIIFVSNSNSIAATSISREGKAFWISKVLPVSPLMQILSKLAAASLVTLLLIIITLAGEFTFLHFSASELFSQALLALSGSLLTMGFGLFVDLSHPKLNWTDPQQVMKRNLGAFIAIFSTMAFLGLSGWFLYGLAKIFALSPGALVKLVTVIYILLAGLMFWLINSRADNLYRRIEC